MTFSTPLTSSFIAHFDLFLRKPEHFFCKGTDDCTVLFLVDPTTVLVKILRDEFGKTRYLVQLNNEEFCFRMCVAYQAFWNLTETVFDPINRVILAKARECQTDDNLLELLEGAVCHLETMKLEMWNNQVRSEFLFQLIQSTSSVTFATQGQRVYERLRISVLGDIRLDRKLVFYDCLNLVALYSIENIKYRRSVTTPITGVKMIEFSGLICGVQGTRHSSHALFRIRGKEDRSTQHEGIRSIIDLHDPLIDLIANYLDYTRN